MYELISPTYNPTLPREIKENAYLCLSPTLRAKYRKRTIRNSGHNSSTNNSSVDSWLRKMESEVERDYDDSDAPGLSF